MTLAEAQHADGRHPAVEHAGARRAGCRAVARTSSGCSPPGSRSPTSTSTSRAARPVQPTRRTSSAPSTTAWSRVSCDDHGRGGDRGPRHLAVAPARPRRSTGACRSVSGSPGPSGVTGTCPRPRRGRGRPSPCWCSARRSSHERGRSHPLARRAASVLGLRLRRRGSDRPDRPEDLRGRSSPETPGGCSTASTGSEDLWLAEARWWHRVEQDGFGLLRRSSLRPGAGGGRGRPCSPPTPGGSGRRSRWPRAAAGRHWRCSMPWREVGRAAADAARGAGRPVAALRDMLVQVADAGVVELDLPTARSPASARRRRGCPGRLPTSTSSPVPAVTTWSGGRPSCGRTPTARSCAARLPPSPAGRRRRAGRRSPSALARAGAGAVPIPAPRGVDPPTLLQPGEGVRQSFTPLVETYGTVPYADVDPTLLAGLAYVRHVRDDVRRRRARCRCSSLAGLLLRAGRPRGSPGSDTVWPFVVGAGLAAMRVRPALRRVLRARPASCRCCGCAPLERAGHPAGRRRSAWARCCWPAPTPLGTVNRWREGGWPLALLRPLGHRRRRAVRRARRSSLLGLSRRLGWLVAGRRRSSWRPGCCWRSSASWPTPAAAPPGSPRRRRGLRRRVRLGANLVSFARLAAFGLTHAALGLIVWEATAGLWERGGLAGRRGRRSSSCVGQRRRLRPRGAGRRGPGAAPGVLRAVLPGLHQRGPAVPARGTSPSTAAGPGRRRPGPSAPRRQP